MIWHNTRDELPEFHGLTSEEIVFVEDTKDRKVYKGYLHHNGWFYKDTPTSSVCACRVTKNWNLHALHTDYEEFVPIADKWGYLQDLLK